MLSLRRLSFAVALSAVAACSSVTVTPQKLHDARVPESERDQLVQTWTTAVGRCNEFLASPFRHALPPGHFTLDPAHGMRFECDGHTWPIQVRSTSWGDLVLWCGFQAQERTYGFTVGECPPERDRVADNALFRDAHGAALGVDTIADLILHETTHVVSGEGALGFWKSTAYYCEAFFLFRYGPTHSDERRAYGTSEEYETFAQVSDATPPSMVRALTEALDRHMAKGATKSCRHDTIVVAP